MRRIGRERRIAKRWDDELMMMVEMIGGRETNLFFWKGRRLACSERETQGEGIEGIEIEGCWSGDMVDEGRVLVVP